MVSESDDRAPSASAALALARGLPRGRGATGAGPV